MDYKLRDIDPEFWLRVKMKALRERMSVKKVITSLLWAWIEGRVDLSSEDEENGKVEVSDGEISQEGPK